MIVADSETFVTESAPLAALARQINAAHDLCQQSSRSTLERARECGDLLRKAKSRTLRGQWVAWLKENVKCTPRTCQYYMKVCEQWAQLEAKSEAVSQLTLKCAIKMLAPEKPPKYMAMEEYISARYQRFLAWRKQAVTTFKWSGAYETYKKEDAIATDLEEKASRARIKASQARARAKTLHDGLLDGLKREFESQEPSAK